MRYGEQWKKQRKVTQGVLHASIIQDFYPMMVRKSRFSLARLIDNPDSFGPELRWYVTTFKQVRYRELIYLTWKDGWRYHPSLGLRIRGFSFE